MAAPERMSRTGAAGGGRPAASATTPHTGMAPAARRARGRTPVSVPLRNSLDLTAPSANNVGMVGHETIAGGQRSFHAVESARVPRDTR